MNNKIANTYTSISVHTILTLAWVHEHNRSKGLQKSLPYIGSNNSLNMEVRLLLGLHEQEAQT